MVNGKRWNIKNMMCENDRRGRSHRHTRIVSDSRHCRCFARLMLHAPVLALLESLRVCFSSHEDPGRCFSSFLTGVLRGRAPTVGTLGPNVPEAEVRLARPGYFRVCGLRVCSLASMTFATIAFLIQQMHGTPNGRLLFEP